MVRKQINTSKATSPTIKLTNNNIKGTAFLFIAYCLRLGGIWLSCLTSRLYSSRQKLSSDLFQSQTNLCFICENLWQKINHNFCVSKDRESALLWAGNGQE